VRKNKRGASQIWALTALVLWMASLLTVGLSMHREQALVRAELVARQNQLQQLERILEIVRDGARLGCSRAEDYRDRLEARRFRALPSAAAPSNQDFQFTIPLKSGDNAWLSISCPPEGRWLARTGLASGFEELELCAYLHPIRRPR
jgi:hypothetical protein